MAIYFIALLLYHQKIYSGALVSLPPLQNNGHKIVEDAIKHLFLLCLQFRWGSVWGQLGCSASSSGSSSSGSSWATLPAMLWLRLRSAPYIILPGPRWKGQKLFLRSMAEMQAGKSNDANTFQPPARVKPAYLQWSHVAIRNHPRLNALDLSILQAPFSSEAPSSILVSLTHAQPNIPFLKCPSESRDQNKSCLQDLLMCK